jgi:hypothetical protein
MDVEIYIVKRTLIISGETFQLSGYRNETIDSKSWTIAEMYLETKEHDQWELEELYGEIKEKIEDYEGEESFAGFSIRE